MNTPTEIKIDLYRHITPSALAEAITGNVSYTGRETDREDCCISVQDSDNDQIQTAFVYVNVYVPKIPNNGRKIDNVPRLKVLEKLCEQVLQTGRGETFRFELKKQLTIDVRGKDESVISNKIEYSQFNG